MKRFLITSLLGMTASTMASASSHREAPAISQDAPADITDLYAFRSPGREDTHVTLVMNVYPAQLAASGPNWYRFGDNVRYDFNIDTTGDAVADVVFRFNFETKVEGALPLAYLSPGLAPLAFNGPRYSNGLTQNYMMTKVVLGGQDLEIVPAPGKPVAPARIGPRTTDRASEFGVANTDRAYEKLIEPVTFEGDGYRVFAGPRNDPFFIDLGAVFDTLNVRSPAIDTLAGINCLSIVVDVPLSEIFGSSNKKIMGVWATTSRNQVTFARATDANPPKIVSGGWVQVARLGNPLINELVIGLQDKDRFNASHPKDDAQFANYVLNPALALALNVVFGGAGLQEVRTSDRQDLALALTLGVPGINEIAPNGPIADMLRINVGVPTGFPNGRALTDDVVDISLKVVAECSTKALGLPADLPSSRNYDINSLNCKLADGVDADDVTPNGSGINVTDADSFPYVGIPHSNFEAPMPKQASL